MTKVGLHMIVKDEAHVIERCLRSVLPLVDWWVIADTGSTDGTQEIVRRVMEGIPGRVVEHPWQNFGHNRQLALDAARALPESSADDVALWIDADEEFVGLPERGADGQWLDLPAEHDGIWLDVHYDALRYQRLAGVRLGRGWSWREPVHEFLELPGASVVTVAAPRVLVRSEGARSQDPEKFRKDAALLAAELTRRPDDARTQFYLAQSLADAGDLDGAVEMYRRRAENFTGWESERAVALHRLARSLELRGASVEELADAYARAWDAAPHRAEPLVDWARIERSRERYQVAQMLAERAVSLPAPAASELFVDVTVHQWRAWDEYAVSSSWAGRHDVALQAAERALAGAPSEPRLVANVAWLKERLAASAQQ